MKKWSLILLGLMTVVSLAACGTVNNSDGNSVNADSVSKDEEERDTNQDVDNEKENDMTFKGYIGLFEDGRILVTENDVGRELKPDEFNEVAEEAGQMIFFDLQDLDDELVDSLEIGDHVAIEHGPVGMSFPGQSVAKRLEVIDE
ncbi:hypothetical protein ABID56_001432 [Alkalibacillus flavidus]|uniref:DUF3221 domain-containing protein n=1 Tax=Alkalibacillus flavidus TaxID=546021 RepID=A0ABV2KUU1_9BACI